MSLSPPREDITEIQSLTVYECRLDRVFCCIEDVEPSLTLVSVELNCAERVLYLCSLTTEIRWSLTRPLKKDYISRCVDQSFKKIKKLRISGLLDRAPETPVFLGQGSGPVSE